MKHREWRFKNAEITLGQWGFSVKYHHGFYFSRRAKVSFDLGPLTVFVDMPWLVGPKQGDDCEWPSYGFDMGWRELVISRGDRDNLYIRFPWDWTHVRTSYMKADRTWKHQLKGKKLPPNCALGSAYGFYNHHDDPELWRETFPYTYELKSGEIQYRKATVEVGEWEWRWRWFQWLPFPRMVRRSIDISFDDEVGERSGSWKGGTIGCSWNMLPGETEMEALRRMELERAFR